MYKRIANSDCILRLSDGACIPLDENNSDYRDYIEWAQSNITEDADPEPEPPAPLISTISPQTQAVLVQLREMTPSQVEAWVDANITDLPTLITAFKQLAVAVAIIRQQMKGAR